MKDKYDYSKMQEQDIDKILKDRYKDSSKYLRKVWISDLIKYSKKKNDEQTNIQ